jgi:Ca-activated chloride channel family protein
MPNEYFPMFPKLNSISLVLRSTALVAVVMFGCPGSSVFSQVQPAANTQTGLGSPVLQDPTRAEDQPNLDVERDPIPSPDAEVVVPISTGLPLTKDVSGEVHEGQNGIYTMHADVDEVLLNCAVVDGKGRAVMDLGQSDFRIWEDGVAQATRSFLHQDLPVSLGILVDNSGSMRDKRAAVDSAALNLVLASNPKDSTFIVNFSDRAILDQGFTSDLAALDKGLSHFDSKGTTALYDAVAASADELANHGKYPKQVLLVITDGADNASRLRLEQAIRRVQNLGGPVVYTIGLLFGIDKEESQRAKRDLQLMSEETGGVAYFPQSLQDVNGIAAEVGRDIRNQYTIGYHSSKAVSLGGYRLVNVEAKASGHDKLTVRTRKGYFAKKPGNLSNQKPKEVKQ